MDLENSFEKCDDLIATNPNEPTPLTLHQGLILRLYHFHLALCPLKHISDIRIEEIEPPTVPNMSPAESKGPMKKIQSTPTDPQKPKPTTKKLKAIDGVSQTSVTISLCDLMSTPAKTLVKPRMKKKGKEEKVPLNKGRNVMSKDSLGDTVVAETIVISCDVGIRRSGKLAKNKKKVQIRDLETEEEFSNSKYNRVEKVSKDEEDEKYKGPSFVSEKGKAQKEVLASHSLEPLEIEQNDPNYTTGGGEELGVLKEILEILDKKFYGLTHLMVKMIHYVTSTLSATMKDELGMKKTEDHQEWVGDDMVQLMSENQEKANQYVFGQLLVCVCCQSSSGFDQVFSGIVFYLMLF